MSRVPGRQISGQGVLVNDSIRWSNGVGCRIRVVVLAHLDRVVVRWLDLRNGRIMPVGVALTEVAAA
jgi:hypothetical protein